MTAVGSYPMRSDEAELAEMLLWAAGIPYSTVFDDAHPSDPRRRVRVLVEDADANDAVALLTDQLRPVDVIAKS
jgi:hypothetical protein